MPSGKSFSFYMLKKHSTQRERVFKAHSKWSEQNLDSDLWTFCAGLGSFDCTKCFVSNTEHYAFKWVMESTLADQKKFFLIYKGNLLGEKKKSPGSKCFTNC